MDVLQKAKLLKELKQENEAKVGLKGLSLAKALKKILDLRNQLGFSKVASNNEPNVNKIFQAVIDGQKTLSIETLQEVLLEAQNNPDDSLLVPATKELQKQYSQQISNL